MTTWSRNMLNVAELLNPTELLPLRETQRDTGGRVHLSLPVITLMDCLLERRGQNYLSVPGCY